MIIFLLDGRLSCGKVGFLCPEFSGHKSKIKKKVKSD
jgi:hypothetical protein